MTALKTPLWRCAIISLLLWALPLQWLASAASLPCAGEVHGKGDVALVSNEQAPAPFEQSAVLATVHGHQHDVQSDERPAAHEGHDGDAGASAHAHTKCAGVGHCCLSMALISPVMPDFLRRSASLQCAALPQQHRAPLLRGPERPPKTHSA